MCDELTGTPGPSRLVPARLIIVIASHMMFNRVQIVRIILVASLAACPVFGGVIGSQASEIPPDLSITLERTRCYGFCPSYVLKISATGKVAYEGRASVKLVGNAESSISQEKLRELIQAFEEINYFDLKARYESPNDGCKDWVTDGPTAITSLTINGRSKSVRHYSGCRGIAVLAGLEKLEQAIDDAANTQQWIR